MLHKHYSSTYIHKEQRERIYMYMYKKKRNETETETERCQQNQRISSQRSKWANPRVKRQQTNQATPEAKHPKAAKSGYQKLTRSKMSDGLIGLNAGKIYLSTLVGFGFCHPLSAFSIYFT